MPLLIHQKKLPVKCRVAWQFQFRLMNIKGNLQLLFQEQLFTELLSILAARQIPELICFDEHGNALKWHVNSQ